MGSALSSVREWSGLLARYAWTRPLTYRLAGVLALAYTVVVAIDDKTALIRWLLSLLFALVGRGMTLAAPKTSASDTYGREGLHDPVGLVLRRLPLPVARRLEFVMGVTQIVVGLALAVGSLFAL